MHGAGEGSPLQSEAPETNLSSWPWPQRRPASQFRASARWASCPARSWGAGLGLLMGAVVNLLRRVLSPVKSALLGAAVAAALAACWPFLFPFPTWVETRTFLLWQGAPSLISIVAGAVGWLLVVSPTPAVDGPDAAAAGLPWLDPSKAQDPQRPPGCPG